MVLVSEWDRGSGFDQVRVGMETGAGIGRGERRGPGLCDRKRRRDLK